MARHAPSAQLQYQIHWLQSASNQQLYFLAIAADETASRTGLTTLDVTWIQLSKPLPVTLEVHMS
jgi:hypothetical protein